MLRGACVGAGGGRQGVVATTGHRCKHDVRREGVGRHTAPRSRRAPAAVTHRAAHWLAVGSRFCRSHDARSVSNSSIACGAATGGGMAVQLCRQCGAMQCAGVSPVSRVHATGPVTRSHLVHACVGEEQRGVVERHHRRRRPVCVALREAQAAVGHGSTRHVAEAEDMACWPRSRWQLPSCACRLLLGSRLLRPSPPPPRPCAHLNKQ